MIKKFICLCVLIVVAFFGVGCALTLNNQPDSKNEEFIGETISYVSLGDSIPEGYYLPKYEEKDEYGFVKQSYTHSLKSFFESKYKEVHAHNYATAGLTSTQLKEQLMALDGQTLSPNEEEMKMNIIGADVITVCIGANDILTPALDNFLNIVLNEDISSYLTEFDNGIAAFTSNFPIIVSKLKELNPTAKLIFSNIYNPYKDFITATSNIEIYYLLYKIYDIPYEKINLIGQISEAYVDGDTIYEAGQAVKIIDNGLNQVIEKTIAGIENCYLLDVKTCFDNSYNLNNSYEIVNASVLKYNRISFEFSNLFDTEQTLAELQIQILPYIDPHPSTLGHEKINDILIQKVTDTMTQNT